jgi:hydrogenase maturation protease
MKTLPTQILVIGYGNTLRGDDGVGPRVAEQLAAWHWPGLRSQAVHQLTPELAAAIAQVDIVFFVDAWIAPDDHTEAIQPRMEQLFPDASITGLNHVWSPHLLLQLAQTLYTVQPVAYHLLIPVRQFDYGATLSAIAHRGVDWAVQTIQATIEAGSVCHA